MSEFTYHNRPTPNINATSNAVRVQAYNYNTGKHIRGSSIQICVGWQVMERLGWNHGDRVQFVEKAKTICIAKDHGQFKLCQPSNGALATINFTGRYLRHNPDEKTGFILVKHSVRAHPAKPEQSMLVIPSSDIIFEGFNQWV